MNCIKNSYGDVWRMAMTAAPLVGTLRKLRTLKEVQNILSVFLQWHMQRKVHQRYTSIFSVLYSADIIENENVFFCNI